MLRPPLKPALNTSVEQFQSNGGQIQPATNSGKVSIGQYSERVRGRRKRAKGRAV